MEVAVLFVEIMEIRAMIVLVKTGILKMLNRFAKVKLG